MIAEYSDGSASVTKEAMQENERLVLAIANGDREAERTFAERYLRPVRALLLARSRLPDLAADLQQDVMIEAICALRSGQLRDAQKLSAFVSAIARNRLNNHYRSSRRTEALELPDDLPDLTNANNDIEEQQREAQAMLAISSLEPMDKTILQMTLVDGLKPGVIAKRLQLNPDVVRQRKLRATRRVIEFVQRQSQNETPGHSIVGKVT